MFCTNGVGYERGKNNYTTFEIKRKTEKIKQQPNIVKVNF